MEKRAMAVREEQWLQTIAAAKQSGQPIKVWCAGNGRPCPGPRPSRLYRHFGCPSCCRHSHRPYCGRAVLYPIIP